MEGQTKARNSDASKRLILVSMIAGAISVAATLATFLITSPLGPASHGRGSGHTTPPPHFVPSQITLAVKGATSVRAVAFSPDSRYLAAGDENGSTYIWKVSGGGPTAVLKDPATKGVTSVAFSPAGNLAVGDANGSVYLWKGGVYSQLADPASKGVKAVAFSARGFLAVADANGLTYIWNVATDKVVGTLSAPGAVGVQAVAFSYDGEFLATGNADGRVYVWATPADSISATLTDTDSTGVNAVAVRRRGKGRKGQRRIQRIERAEKAWPTPLQALLVAERCAALSGCDTDFVMITTLAYTGMRWSEVIGLGPECVHDGALDVSWKLYELDGRFYRGRPKDGSIRPADLPPFLGDLLARYIEGEGRPHCTCRQADRPWCAGGDYVFLGPRLGHFRRSNYSERFFRPAADGWYLPHGKIGRMPVLVNADGAFPRRPLPPWPPAEPGVPFAPPGGRGVIRLASDASTGRCAACRRAMHRRLDGSVITHNIDGARCPGSGQQPADDVALASWLPVLRGLTPHGLRHGHQTWMDEDRICRRPEVRADGP